MGFDIREQGGLAFVGENFDVFAEFEHFLSRETDNPSVGVGDSSLACQGEDFEGKLQGPLETGHLFGDVVGGGDGGSLGCQIGIFFVHEATMIVENLKAMVISQH